MSSLSLILLPPANLHKVIEGVYRSAFPEERNYEYLETLHLKTVITLVDEEYPKFKAFLAVNGIAHYVIAMAGTKEGISTEVMSAAMKVLLDSSNYPVLVHCNQGKHRTGCVIGTMRKIGSWDISRIVEEYSNIAAPKIRPCDLKYLTDLDASLFERSQDI